MRERLGLSKVSDLNRLWLAVPLVVFALITLTVGLVARRTVREPYSTPFFHLFFRDTLDMKAWLVTAALVLGVGQLLTAARIYELLRFPSKGSLYQVVHRWSGRAAVVLTLPVAYHCVFLLGFDTHSPRVLIHSLLGSAFYGLLRILPRRHRTRCRCQPPDGLDRPRGEAAPAERSLKQREASM